MSEESHNRATDTSASRTNCPAWCTDHYDDGEPDGGWCSSVIVRIGDAHLQISNGTANGKPAIYGLRDLDDEVSPHDAEHAAFLLLGYARAVRA